MEGKNRWVWDASNCCSIRPCVVGDALRRIAGRHSENTKRAGLPCISIANKRATGFVNGDPRACCVRAACCVL